MHISVDMVYVRPYVQIGEIDGRKGDPGLINGKRILLFCGAYRKFGERAGGRPTYLPTYLPQWRRR